MIYLQHWFALKALQTINAAIIRLNGQYGPTAAQEPPVKDPGASNSVQIVALESTPAVAATAY
jgi:hypothetical protein